MDAAGLVRRLYEAYQARDWAAAGRQLHPAATVEMPATKERLTGRDGVLAFQRAYPEPWGDLTVLRVVGSGDEACAEVEVVAAPPDVFRLAAFWLADGGLLREGVEYWVTVGGEQPPPGRPTAPASE